MPAFMEPAAEIERERALIKQSNDRIGGIGAVFGAVLMVLTVLLVQTNGRLSGFATFLAAVWHSPGRLSVSRSICGRGLLGCQSTSR